jgi:hypothetical protein
MLRYMGAIDENTLVVTSIHDSQVRSHVGASRLCTIDPLLVPQCSLSGPSMFLERSLKVP